MDNKIKSLQDKIYTEWIIFTDTSTLEEILKHRNHFSQKVVSEVEEILQLPTTPKQRLDSFYALMR